MGIIIAKLRRKKAAVDRLEELESEIKSIEEFGRTTEESHKKIAARFILFSVLIYMVTLFVCYFYFLPVSLYEQLFYFIPLGLVPIVIIYIKKILAWYYNRKLKKNQNKLGFLRDEKKKILNNVMETETYKVAKDILDKYAPEPIKKPVQFTPSKQITPIVNTLGSTNLTGIRYRGGANENKDVTLRNQAMMTPFSKNQTPITSRKPPGTIAVATPLKLPKSILPKERSVIDRMVDYLIGDGPSNRYALICKQCAGHNGMAFKNEFEYFSFRCCYCSTFNPARKQRPTPPTIQVDTTFVTPNSDTSDDEKKSSSDSDSDSVDGVKAIGTEQAQVQNIPHKEPMEVDAIADGNGDEAAQSTNPFESNCEMEIDSGVEKDNDNIKSDEND